MFSLMLVLGLIIASALFFGVAVAAMPANSKTPDDLDHTLAEAEKAICEAVKRFKRDLERVEH